MAGALDQPFHSCQPGKPAHEEGGEPPPPVDDELLLVVFDDELEEVMDPPAPAPPPPLDEARGAVLQARAATAQRTETVPMRVMATVLVLGLAMTLTSTIFRRSLNRAVCPGQEQRWRRG